ncbi:MAG: prefoldin subunit beta [Candidatus Undinarchaeales archaeon]
MTPEMQKKLAEYQETQQKARMLMSQKQQLQVEKKEAENALDELKGRDKAEVHKSVGSILIKTSKKDVEKELSEKVESLDVRLKSMSEKEKKLTDKLKGIQDRLQGSMGK